MRTARRRFDRRAAGLLCGVLAACSTDGEVLTSLPPSEPIVPRAAGDFTDSVGITIQPVRFATSFEQAVLPRLASLGVRHVRQWAVVPGADAAADAEVAALSTLAAMGLRLHLIFEPRFGVEPAHVAPLAQALGDALQSVEGPNDNDANDVDLGADEVVAYLRELRDAIDAAELTGRVQLVDALDIEPEDKGDLSQVLDYGNFERPRDGAIPGLDLGDFKRAARSVCGAKPLMVTECGYATAEGATGVSELSAAKYVLRLVLGHFAQNIARTYIDELNDGPEDPSVDFMSQGLVQIDGTPKPAYGALQRLLALLADDGSPVTPVPLELEIDSRSPDLRRVLLQKSDGSYALALWLERESFDLDAREELAVEPIRVHVALDAAARRLAVYEPLHDERPVRERRDGTELDVEVGDHPALLMIEPER